MQRFTFTTRFKVVGEFDPQLPGRVLGLFTCKNAFPAQMTCRVHGEGQIILELTLHGTDGEEARLLREKVLRIPTVTTVTFSTLVRLATDGRLPTEPLRA